MRFRFGLLALWAMLAALDAPPPPRTEVPIREVVLSDGTRRYAVPITVGATRIDAGLDTGSSGLRVLPNVLAPGDATAGGWGGTTYSYGSGAELRGASGKGVVAIGGLSAPISLQLVRSVGCTHDKPRCPASLIPQAQYGVQGDGLPGEGFKAILGVNMAEAEVATPLRAVGARRWIVELPRPGEQAPGRLILNPSAEETQGYVMLPILPEYAAQHGGLHDAVRGCLIDTSTRQKTCGAVLMDCGAPGIDVHGLVGRPWPNGTPAILAFFDASGRARAAEKLTIGERAQASRLGFSAAGGWGTSMEIYSGLTAYFAFSVLYDPEHGQIGLKPRPQADGGPDGQLIADAPR